MCCLFIRARLVQAVYPTMLQLHHFGLIVEVMMFMAGSVGSINLQGLRNDWLPAQLAQFMFSMIQ